MAGTRAGGLKAARTNKARKPDYYSNIGKKGGSVEVTKGFGTNKPLARMAGSKGGKVKTARIRVRFE